MIETVRKSHVGTYVFLVLAVLFVAGMVAVFMMFQSHRGHTAIFTVTGGVEAVDELNYGVVPNGGNDQAAGEVSHTDLVVPFTAEVVYGQAEMDEQRYVYVNSFANSLRVADDSDTFLTCTVSVDGVVVVEDKGPRCSAGFVLNPDGSFNLGGLE